MRLSSSQKRLPSLGSLSNNVYFHSLLEELGSPGDNRGILQGTRPEQTNAFYSNRFPFKDSLAGDLYKLLIPLCFFPLQVLGRVGGPGNRAHVSNVVPACKGGQRERGGGAVNYALCPHPSMTDGVNMRPLRHLSVHVKP